MPHHAGELSRVPAAPHRRAGRDALACHRHDVGHGVDVRRPGSWLSHIDTQGGYLSTCALSVVLIFTLERRLQQPLSVGADPGVR
jgi:hypothetical protein